MINEFVKKFLIFESDSFVFSRKLFEGYQKFCSKKGFLDSFPYGIAVRKMLRELNRLSKEKNLNWKFKSEKISQKFYDRGNGTQIIKGISFLICNEFSECIVPTHLWGEKEKYKISGDSLYLNQRLDPNRLSSIEGIQELLELIKTFDLKTQSLSSNNNIFLMVYAILIQLQRADSSKNKRYCYNTFVGTSPNFQEKDLSFDEFLGKFLRLNPASFLTSSLVFSYYRKISNTKYSDAVLGNILKDFILKEYCKGDLQILSFLQGKTLFEEKLIKGYHGFYLSFPSGGGGENDRKIESVS